MTALYLIRHGQASFGKADYDMLSTLGLNQASLLGQRWLSKSVPAKAFAGNMLRHGQTLERFMEHFPNQQVPVIFDAGFNEFDHVDVLTRYNKHWQNFAQMSEQISQDKDANRIFQQEFHQALARWTGGEFDHQYREAWPQFKSRCVTALKNLIAQELAKPSGNNYQASNNKTINTASNDILVFTSGGTIAVIVQHILQLNDQQTIQINQQLRNTSVSKLLFSKDRLTVDYFNNYSHLEVAGEQWITFK